MEFSGTFTIGRKEVSLFTRRIQWSQKEVSYLLFSAVGLIAGNFVLRVFDKTPAMLPQILCSLAGGLVVFALCYGTMLYSIAKSCNAEFTAGRRWAYTQTLHITPMGVTCTTEESAQSRADFDELTVEECKEAFYIFTAKDAAWILPKKQLTDPVGDAAKVREIFTTMTEPQRLNLQKVKN